MKKCQWKRKIDKRKKRNETDKGIVDFVMVIRHFFQCLPEWISEIKDPRNISYITYTQADLIYMGLLKNVCSVNSMKQMEDFFNEENCIRTLSLLSGDRELKEMPHSDTLNYYLSRLSPECLQLLRTRMIRTLIRSKVFNRSRLLNQYWRVILDGTGLFAFHERHCANCLKQTIKGADGKQQIIYYHKVLEAKLVIGDGFVISLGTEFIENENEDVGKQDCEVKAAKRLLVKIKKEFPRLKIVLQGDALYETESFMKMCKEELGWEYLFTHKDSRQPNMGEDYRLLEEEDKTIVNHIGKEHGTGIFYNGMERLSGREEARNIFEYKCEPEKKGKKRLQFQWVTSIKLTRYRIEEMIACGRGRWQIENEGFNVQKNVLYHIEHLNSRNATGMKNHYLLTQIADILLQLYTRRNIMVKEFGQSRKNTSSRLLESFRSHTVTDEDVLYIERHTSVYLE